MSDEKKRDVGRLFGRWICLMNRPGWGVVRFICIYGFGMHALRPIDIDSMALSRNQHEARSYLTLPTRAILTDT